jgi:DsrE/DsrF-like family
LVSQKCLLFSHEYGNGLSPVSLAGEDIWNRPTEAQHQLEEVRIMAKYLFMLTRGTDDPSRATRCLQLAKVAKEEGHDVHVFLTDDAVYLAKKGITENVVAPTGDDAETFMQYLIKEKVPLYV